MSRPVLALALKGDKFTDPIDGKVLNRSCLMAMERKQCITKHSFFRKTSFTLAISK
jgi:hypothetical protein